MHKKKLVEVLEDRLNNLLEKEAKIVDEVAKAYFIVRKGSVESPEEAYLAALAGFSEKDREKWEKTWNTMTKGRVHKWTACVNKMKGKVKNPEAYCSSLARFVGYDPKTGKKSKKKSKSKSKKKSSVEYIQVSYLPQHIAERFGSFGKFLSYLKEGKSDVYIVLKNGKISGEKFLSLIRASRPLLLKARRSLNGIFQNRLNSRFAELSLGIRAFANSFLRSAEDSNSIEKIASVLYNYESLKEISFAFTRYLLINTPNEVKKLSSLFDKIPRISSHTEKENLKDILASVDMKNICTRSMLLVLAQAEEPSVVKAEEPMTTSTDMTNQPANTTGQQTSAPSQPQGAEDMAQKEQRKNDCKRLLETYLNDETAEEICSKMNEQNTQTTM